MEKSGLDYIATCVSTVSGDFLVGETFKLTPHSNGTAFVKMIVGFNGDSFSIPVIYTSDGVVPLTEDNIDLSLTQRRPIYSVLSSIICMVEISGNFDIANKVWKKSPALSTLLPRSVITDNGSLKILFSRGTLEKHLVKSFSLGDVCIRHDTPIGLEPALVRAVVMNLDDKRSFYIARSRLNV